MYIIIKVGTFDTIYGTSQNRIIFSATYQKCSETLEVGHKFTINMILCGNSKA